MQENLTNHIFFGNSLYCEKFQTIIKTVFKRKERQMEKKHNVYYWYWFKNDVH